MSEPCQTLSTADIPRASRLRRWNDFGSETLSSMSVDPADRDAFRAKITRMPIGTLGFTWMTTTPAKACSLSGGTGAWATPTCDAFLLIVQEWGRSCLRQAGREAMLESGEMALQDAATPWRHEARESMGLIMVKLPTQALLGRIGDPTPLVATALRGRQGRTALAASVLRSIRHTLADEHHDKWGDTLSDIILDALEMAYGRSTSSGQSIDCKVTQRREMRSYVEAHLHDPGLTVSRIAAAIGVGTRYLQRLCLEAGATPRQYVLDRRLDAAAGRLRLAATERQESVTDVAYAVGFGDLSYFSRAFTRKYGVCPRDYRRGARAR